MLSVYLHRSRRNTRGFSVIEVVVGAAITAALAAIAIPLTVRQQARTVETAIRTDLVDVSNAINSGSRLWRAGAPSRPLFICLAPYSSTFPVNTPRPNTCGLDTSGNQEWAVLTATGQHTIPKMSGSLSNQVRLQGYIAPDGSYCLDGSSTKAGVQAYRLTSDAMNPEIGTCLAAAWVPTGGLRGATKPGWGTAPQPGIGPAPTPSAANLTADVPTGVAVCQKNTACAVTNTTGSRQLIITWNATPNITYKIDVSGQPSRQTYITSGNIGACMFPAIKCTGQTFTGMVRAGAYKVEVRAKNTVGWSAPATVQFTVAP